LKTSEQVSPADAALTEAVDALMQFGGLMLRTGTEGRSGCASAWAS
jgi:hypothetical protein